MNFQSMRYFVILAEERNFSKAANRIFITQQSLSSSIASIEKELGCQLIVRHTPLELTYAGEKFLQYAKTYTQLQDTMQKEFSDISSNQIGSLRIGTSYSRSMIFFPSLIDEFQMIHPNIHITLYEDLDLERKLTDHYLDLVLSGPMKNNSTLEFAPLFEDQYYLVVSKELLRSYRISPEVLGSALYKNNLKPLINFPFILSETGGNISTTAHQLFLASGFEPYVRCEAVNMNTIFALCLKGLGACFTHKILAWSLLSDSQKDQLYFFSLPESYTLPIGFSYAKNTYQWSILKEFIDMAHRKYPELKEQYFPYIFG